jgi:hypothetical protein
MPESRTLATLTDADVKHRRTVTLGTLTGRLRAVRELWMGGLVCIEVECGPGVIAEVRAMPRETPVEVRS